MELFCGNSQCVKAIGCFSRGAPWLFFDRILNVILCLRRFPPLGLHKAILNFRCLLILLIHTKNKNNKMKFWTDSTPLFPLRRKVDPFGQKLGSPHWFISFMCTRAFDRNIWFSFTYVFFCAWAHDHSTKIYDPLSFIFSFVRDHSTKN